MPPRKPTEETLKPSSKKKSATVTQMAEPSRPPAVGLRSHESFAALEEQIRSRAYQLWQERGGGQGQEEKDWLQAEAEIIERFQKRSA